MKIQLSDRFDYGKLIRFTLPSIGMLVFTSIYGVVDGYFVSNYVGEKSFAAVNLIMPVLMILSMFGFMFGTGGSALIAKTLGEGDKEKANRIFSMLVWVSALAGVILAVAGIVFLPQIAALLGAEGELLEDCVLYGRCFLAALPLFMLQQEFQSFFVVAERPNLGLYTILAAGVMNMVLDALVVGVCRGGLVGAAVATGISQLVGAAVPLVYFARKNTSLLRLGAFRWDGKSLLKSCVNGSSELMSNISMSLVSMLYNAQLLKYYGDQGVSAYGVLMYVSLIFSGVFIGYSVGIAPVVGYHYGAGNHGELKGLLQKSTVLVGVFSVCMFAASLLLASPLARLFVGYNAELTDLTVYAFRIFSFSFLFCGFAIFASGFFTALNNGVVSAVISFLRTLVFQVAAILLLPLLFGVDGIWYSIVVAEVFAVLVAVVFLFALRKKYRY